MVDETQQNEDVIESARQKRSAIMFETLKTVAKSFEKVAADDYKQDAEQETRNVEGEMLADEEQMDDGALAQQQLVAFENRLSELERQRARIDGDENSIQALQNRLNALELKVNELAEKITTLENDVADGQSVGFAAAEASEPDPNPAEMIPQPYGAYKYQVLQLSADNAGTGDNYSVIWDWVRAHA